jgi:hypothetical protein
MKAYGTWCGHLQADAVLGMPGCRYHLQAFPVQLQRLPAFEWVDVVLVCPVNFMKKKKKIKAAIW